MRVAYCVCDFSGNDLRGDDKGGSRPPRIKLVGYTRGECAMYLQGAHSTFLTQYIMFSTFKRITGIYSHGHQGQGLKQRKCLAVLHIPALEKVGTIDQRTDISRRVIIEHKSGGVLEAPGGVCVQELLQPAVADEQPPAADDAQKRGRIAAAGVTHSSSSSNSVQLRHTC